MRKTTNGLAEKWAKGFTDQQARELISSPQAPIATFPMKYVWHLGPWYDIFDLQISLIRADIRRAKAEDKQVIYLSCPISSRGGGYSGTNVDVAKHVERSLLDRWGEAFWILNPAQYQLESKAGTGLINRHAEYLGLDLDRLTKAATPSGGDYMRMWTTVLVENDAKAGNREVGDHLVNTGQYFDAFYFLGPRDVQTFFLNVGDTLTEGIQVYFARKFATDADFRSDFSEAGLDWEALMPPGHLDQNGLKSQWALKRSRFLRYYSLRASANFSLGSHDEWLIFCHINALRRRATKNPDRFMVDGDVGEQLAGFFDGNQIDPASTEALVSRGYSQ